MATDPDVALLVEMEAAQAAPEPGPRVNTVVDTGVKDDPEVRLTSVTSAGYVTIYHTKTLEPSQVNRNMLVLKLRERLPDGSRAWTTRCPGEPRRGSIKCLLHPDDDNRGRYDEIGFGVCHKANIMTAYQLRQHMAHRHPREWTTIEDERRERERNEDREFQRSVIKMAGKAAK